MSAPHLPKVAGIDPAVPAPAHTVAPAALPAPPPVGPAHRSAPRRAARCRPGPARRLGLRPHHPARAHRTAGPHRHARRRPARAAARRRRPRRRPARAGRPRTADGHGPDDHHRPRPRPRRPRPHRDRAAQPVVRADPDGSRAGSSARARPRSATPTTGRRPRLARRGPPDLHRSRPAPRRPRPPPPRGRRPARLRRQLRAARSSTDGRRPARRRRLALRRARRARPNASAISSASTARYAAEHLARLLELDRTRARRGDRRARSCCPAGCPGSPASRSPCGTAPARAAAATGTTRCRCPTARWASPSARSPAPGPSAVAAMGRLRAVPAGVRRDGGRGPGRGPLRPGTAAAADRARPLAPPRCSPTASPPLRKIAAGRRRALPAADHRRAAHRVRGDLAVRAAGHARLLGGAERGARRRAAERRCCSTPTGCCTAPASRWTAPSPGCTRPRPARPARPRRPGRARRPRPAHRAAGRRCDAVDASEDVVLLAARFEERRRGLLARAASTAAGPRPARPPRRWPGDRPAARSRRTIRPRPSMRTEDQLRTAASRPYDGGGRDRRRPRQTRGDRERAADQAAEERPVPGRLRRARREHEDRLGRHRAARPGADRAGRRTPPRRRAALSARFPGERLVIPAGNLKTRSNDTEYPFRASAEYAYLTGDQTEDGVLVLEPTGRRATRRRSTCCRAPTGRTASSGSTARASCGSAAGTASPRPSSCYGIPAKDVRELADAAARGRPARSGSCAATTPASRPR